LDSLNAGFWAHDTQSKATPKHNIQPNRKIPFFTELQNYNNPSGNFAVNLSDCPMNPDTRIANNIAKIKEQLPQHCRLIVVSKYRSLEEIQGAYNAHHRDFAENRVQPLLERAEALPSDIHWHLIGHLQTNKVKYIAEFVNLIHAVDSLKLLQEIGVKTSFVGNLIIVKPKSQDPTPKTIIVESDWSSASYFYSIIALSEVGTQIELSSFKENSLQGDAVLAKIYHQHRNKVD
jgi:hypothetical protein